MPAIFTRGIANSTAIIAGMARSYQKKQNTTR